MQIVNSSLVAEQMKLFFFYGPNYFDHRIFDYSELDDILLDDNFDANRTTVLYIHGFQESPESESVHLFVDAYNRRDEHNLIVLDWSDGASGDYLTNAVPNSVTVHD